MTKEIVDDYGIERTGQTDEDKTTTFDTIFLLFLFPTKLQNLITSFFQHSL